MPSKNLFVITPALSGGGIETSMPILLKEINKDFKYKIFWVGINKSNYHGTLPATEIISLGRRSKDGIYRTLMILLQLRKLVVNTQDSILLLNGELPELFACWLPRNTPFICVEHASRPWNKRKILGRFVRRLIAKRAQSWVSVNSNQKLIWPSIRNFTFIPNPIRVVACNSEDLQRGLVYIGRLTKDKGIESVCEVARRTKTQLDVYGEGDLLDFLRRKYNGEEFIKFNGFVENVWEKIGKNRMLISASEHEGDGRTVAEAIIRQQPLLLSDNLDHRRFALPEMNYFKDFDDLLDRVFAFDIESISSFRPTTELAMKELGNRDPSRVAYLWNAEIQRLTK